MIMQIDYFIETMLKLFPQTVSQYKDMKTKYGIILETVIMEDVFIPPIVDLIRCGQNTELIHKVFDLFESVSNCGDQHLRDVFTTTILECIGNDQDVLLKARNYMGPLTKLLQIEAENRLGRK